MAGSGSNATHERGRRAGANAPPTPLQRLRTLPAMEKRLERAGITLKAKRKTVRLQQRD